MKRLMVLLLLVACKAPPPHPYKVTWEHGITARQIERVHHVFNRVNWLFGDVPKVHVHVTIDPITLPGQLTPISALYNPKMKKAFVWRDNPWALYHELGHHVIACERRAEGKPLSCDPLHRDARWTGWNRVYEWGRGWNQ